MVGKFFALCLLFFSCWATNLQLFFDSKTFDNKIVEKEPFKIHAKIYLDDIVSARLEVPQFLGNEVKVIKADEAKDGEEEIDGELLKYREWDILVISTKNGSLKINPVRALVEKEIREMRSGFEMLSRSATWVWSNDLEIDIAPLPDPEIDAVGVFKNFKIYLNDNVAFVGDAVVLTAELEGLGDLENIIYNKLELPVGLTFYESKSFVKDGKKYFEFIIQGNNAGVYKISPQVFTYFDVNNRGCALLKSGGLSLEVKERVVKPVDLKKESKKLSNQEDIKLDQQDKMGWHGFFGKKYLFLLLILLLILSLGLFKLRRRAGNIASKRASKADRFKQARKDILSCRNSSQLILIFYDLLGSISSNELLLRLKDKGLDSLEIGGWLKFYEDLEEARYFKDDSDFAKDTSDRRERVSARFVELQAKSLELLKVIS